VIPLWYGEGDLPTPAFHRRGGDRSPASGAYFYTCKAGLPELRAAIAEYLSGLHPAGPVGAERVLVSSSGMTALMLMARR